MATQEQADQAMTPEQQEIAAELLLRAFAALPPESREFVLTGGDDEDGDSDSRERDAA